jgi:hypothetical protein
MPIYGSYHYLPALSLLQPLTELSKRLQLISYREPPFIFCAVFTNPELFRVT